jgi:NhaA family Na+:H+ antiporter
MNLPPREPTSADSTPTPQDEAQAFGPVGRIMASRGLPPASHWSESAIGRVLSPVQEFMHRSASGGVVLMAATVLALVLANSPWGSAYNEFLHLKLGLSAGSFKFEESLLHWINDGLMAIFFLLVGLEIKREVVVGELSTVRAALLPVLAALGGAIIPAVIYVAFNAGSAGLHGWAVPMATDIAFTLGVLALLGNRVPLSLKIFLTSVAIADDLIAVLVIALFYAGSINFTALFAGLAILLVLAGCNFFGVRSLLVYLGLGVLVWFAFFESGVHATIAGVLVALTIPARVRLNPAEFVSRADRILAHFRSHEMTTAPMITDEPTQSAIAELEDLCEGVQAPLQRLESALHIPVAFLIMPIFALANAGVALSMSGLGGGGWPVVGGIVVGLVLGKPIGLLGATFLAISLGVADLPSGVSVRHMVGGAVLCGIGFTMSLFVASLAFGTGALLGAAKLGILAASLMAGIGGFLLLRSVPVVEEETGKAATGH